MTPREAVDTIVLVGLIVAVYAVCRAVSSALAATLAFMMVAVQ